MIPIPLLPYSDKIMVRIIASVLFTFQDRVMDDTLAVEIGQTLRERLSPVYGEDFAADSFESNGGVTVSFTQSGVHRSVFVSTDEIHAGEMSAEAEFDLRLNQCASAMFELVDLGRRLYDKRLVNVANTQFELGFMALRKSTQEISDESY